MKAKSFQIKAKEIERIQEVVANRPDLQLKGLAGVVHKAIEEWYEANKKIVKGLYILLFSWFNRFFSFRLVDFSVF
jgi:hypothetical protein